MPERIYTPKAEWARTDAGGLVEDLYDQIDRGTGVSYCGEIQGPPAQTRFKIDEADVKVTPSFIEGSVVVSHDNERVIEGVKRRLEEIFRTGLVEEKK